MILARTVAKRGQQGYSLIELLLTTSLLLLFAGLGIVSLKTLTQGSGLDEGAIRFESVLRLARAEAAHSGRRVRVNFVQDTNSPVSQASMQTTNPVNQIQLTWEPNPFEEPDVFQELPTTQWGVNQVNETVGVETVRLMDEEETPPVTDETSEMVDSETENESPPVPPSWITFNPDGSSDSAEITIAARNADDDRRVTMRVEGLTGTISRLEEPESECEPVPDHLEADQKASPIAAK